MYRWIERLLLVRSETWAKAVDALAGLLGIGVPVAHPREQDTIDPENPEPDKSPDVTTKRP
jgi:hypothetical protein